MRRATGRSGKGRRISDGRMWFDGSVQAAQQEGWVATEDGQHICPGCFERMRSLRHVLQERVFVAPGVMDALEGTAEIPLQDRID